MRSAIFVFIVFIYTVFKPMNSRIIIYYTKENLNADNELLLLFQSLKALEKKVKPFIADQKAKAAKAKRMAAKFDELVENALTAPATAASNFEYQISKEGKKITFKLKSIPNGDIVGFIKLHQERSGKDIKIQLLHHVNEQMKVLRIY